MIVDAQGDPGINPDGDHAGGHLTLRPGCRCYSGHLRLDPPRRLNERGPEQWVHLGRVSALAPAEAGVISTMRTLSPRRVHHNTVADRPRPCNVAVCGTEIIAALPPLCGLTGRSPQSSPSCLARNSRHARSNGPSGTIQWDTRSPVRLPPGAPCQTA